jgi:hypothetical protein
MSSGRRDKVPRRLRLFHDIESAMASVNCGAFCPRQAEWRMTAMILPRVVQLAFGLGNLI